MQHRRVRFGTELKKVLRRSGSKIGHGSVPESFITSPNFYFFYYILFILFYFISSYYYFILLYYYFISFYYISEFLIQFNFRVFGSWGDAVYCFMYFNVKIINEEEGLPEMLRWSFVSCVPGKSFKCSGSMLLVLPTFFNSAFHESC